MRLGSISSTTLAAAAAIAALFACGGDEGSKDDNELDDANRTASSAGAGGSGNTVTLPEVCQRQAECPSGYLCVPPASSITTEVDQTCYDSCAGPCAFAGPIQASCEQNCSASCTREVWPPDGELNGTCMEKPSDQGNGSGGSGGNSTPGGEGGSSGSSNSGVSIQWANTWTVDVEYTANCEWTSNVKQSADQKFTVTMQVTGSNSTPKATLSGGYELEGTGGDDRMTLTGDFPMRDDDGDTATQHSLNSPNEVTIRMTTVESATKATGTIEGNWDAGGGWKCKAEGGKITMSR